MTKEDVLPRTGVDHPPAAVKVRIIHPVALLRKKAQFLQAKRPREKFPKKAATLLGVDEVHLVFLPWDLKVEEILQVQQNDR